MKCFNCDQVGHKSKDCKENKKEPQIVIPKGESNPPKKTIADLFENSPGLNDPDEVIASKDKKKEDVVKNDTKKKQKKVAPAP